MWQKSDTFAYLTKTAAATCSINKILPVSIALRKASTYVKKRFYVFTPLDLTFQRKQTKALLESTKKMPAAQLYYIPLRRKLFCKILHS